MTTPILDTALRLGAKLKRIGPAEWAGPCPKCGGRDRFAINTAKGIFNCRGCDVGGDAIELARRISGMAFGEALQFVEDERADRGKRYGTENRAASPPAPDREEASNTEKVAQALSLFRESIGPIDTPAEVYFQSRGLLIGDLAGRVIRWNARIGAMVALFRNIKTGAPQAVSRTYLDANASKIERKFLGPVGGAAIMLDGFDAVSTGLHVGEGLETAQAARQLELRPTWALGSAGAIAAFPALAGVEALTLLAEHDDASARAVEACGSRWHASGRQVLVTKPFRGKDLADVVKGAA